MLPSEMPVIFDTVTLQVFAEMDRLDLLIQLFGHRPTPRWSTEVRAENVKGQNHADSMLRCTRIIESGWLGNDEAPSDLALVLKIQAALSSGVNADDKNLGEAESIALAIERGGVFVTDDKAAYDLARKRPDVGVARVLDAHTILVLAESQSLLTSADVKQFHIDVAARRSMRCRCQY